MPLTRDAILGALSRIVSPATGKDLVASDIIRAVTIEDGKVRFVIEVRPEQAPAMEPVRQAAIAAAEQVAGAGNVSAVITAHAAPKAPDLKIGRHPSKAAGPVKLAGVSSIIGVASGKGGVGKSTVSANIAVALAAMGKAVGLLDADLYGPSLPRMLGLTERPASRDGKTIIPLRAYGVTVMSLGLMLKEDEAVIWRGPMLMGALQQLLGQVDWGTLDVLLVDLPPGTGDVQMTLSQKAEVTGAIVVSTPQDIALIDARKAMNMFQRLGTPVLGMIENMSRYVCPECGHEAHIFGHGGARADAERLKVPFLGEIPLDLDVRLASDAGMPIVHSRPDGPQAAAFTDIARRLIGAGHI
ncbi:MAG: Mrp/NBP35 family ATP-binding protein [Alphaproteobacteria bacterium]|nr:Mrp/NBP35 family ATP-binding protein [Alphaproteobacteria bacterium]NNF25083.1 Mrp/NBP35 family ATP-binding protein [Paracoccaceae bacterium]